MDFYYHSTCAGVYCDNSMLTWRKSSNIFVSLNVSINHYINLLTALIRLQQIFLNFNKESDTTSCVDFLTVAMATNMSKILNCFCHQCWHQSYFSKNLPPTHLLTLISIKTIMDCLYHLALLRKPKTMVSSTPQNFVYKVCILLVQML